jgi:D-alanine-D-alanine ligase-like ATP-grasp enzyme
MVPREGLESEKIAPLAILFQSQPPPEMGGAKKPFKPGGYSDSGADIAFALAQIRQKIVTPVNPPDPAQAFDWVFPDTVAGIENALKQGARTLWLNTVLYAGHSIQKFASQGLQIVGQDLWTSPPYDDKFFTNQLLGKSGLPVAISAVIQRPSLPEKISYPCILKPLRGRGSTGVTRISSEDELKEVIHRWLTANDFGSSFLVEELLPGEEITITVMPPGHYQIQEQEVVHTQHWALRPIQRFNHINMIAPYSGTTAVIHNSAVLSETQSNEIEVSKIVQACAKAAEILQAKAPLRIDCRQNAAGVFKIFDVNFKPNLTGAGRPGRNEEDSLVVLAARALGWSYSDLLLNILRTAWDFSTP